MSGYCEHIHKQGDYLLLYFIFLSVSGYCEHIHKQGDYLLLYFIFLSVSGYCEHIHKQGDYLLLIHVPENYDFTMASEWNVVELKDPLALSVSPNGLSLAESVVCATSRQETMGSIATCYLVGRRRQKSWSLHPVPIWRQ